MIAWKVNGMKVSPPGTDRTLVRRNYFDKKFRFIKKGTYIRSFIKKGTYKTNFSRLKLKKKKSNSNQSLTKFNANFNNNIVKFWIWYKEMR